MKKLFSKFTTALLLLILSLSLIQADDPIINYIDAGARIIGLKFSDNEKDLMGDGLEEQLKHYKAIREYPLPNSVPPANIFNPVPVGHSINQDQILIKWQIPENITIPENRNELAFYSILELASLIKNKKITSVELTKFFIERMKNFGDTLECYITITEDLALDQARKADEVLANGTYLGPLHGIPYGVKDLLAVEGYPTTFGATPFKDQVINETASVVKKLEASGAVLISKLSLGALAWGDVWYGGMTRNPWDLKNGSSGSSAGPASATAAGLVPFSIGSETWGSIVSPSDRCGVTGLRPTYGRVSRTGAMALSWTMDKLGPMCRSAEDCAIVFETIQGMDGIDQSLVNAAFNYDPEINLKDMKIGYLEELFKDVNNNFENDDLALRVFEELGVDLISVQLPYNFPTDALSIILNAEAAAAFDALTRSGEDSLMVRQVVNAWPNVFRQSRLIPAVEYINANRIRYELIQEFNEVIKSFDAIITPSFGGDQMLMTNLTGHPCVVFPNGFKNGGNPTSMCIIGNLFEEEKILAIANQYQGVTDYDDMHPELFQ